MDYYNNERTNQGKYCKGKTPRETLLKGYELYDKYVIKNETSNNCETIIEDRPNHFNSFEAPKELEDEGHLQKLKRKGKKVTNYFILILKLLTKKATVNSISNYCNLTLLKFF